MNAYVYDYNKVIYIKKSNLKNSKVKATDLRCAFALIVAGAMASGTTYIKDIDYLFRGYSKPLEKLKSIGLNVEII
jgi:UDP-N-acetylglucosamine 1-carboxyvinyltransferase